MMQHRETTQTSADQAPPLRGRQDLDSWVLGTNRQMRRVAEHACRASEAQCTALISGETGTGKEVIARYLHTSGPRAARPFVPVNCAALTVSLAESQLFGHEKGAFTGAAAPSLGVFRAAEGGVVFLDEVGEMPLELQPKLLRVLQEQEVTPVGSSQPINIDVQVIAATNRDLEAEVEQGNFREDLFYRMNMLELPVPPLRDRVEDIPELIEFFSKRFAARYQREYTPFNVETLRDFCEYRWPGNVRQMAHVIEQSYVLDCAPSLPSSSARTRNDTSLPFYDLAKLRAAAVRQAMKATQGHKGRAAKLLGVHANTMTRLLAQISLVEDQ
jgi:DNA-binding NtrC family response regulator